MIDIFVEVSGVRPCRNQQDHDGAVPTLVVAFLYPLADVLAIGRVAENHMPPQDCFRPSSSGVKNTLHFAVSGKAQGSNVKWNSLSSSSKKSCGVVQSILLLENRALLNILFGIIQHTRYAYVFVTYNIRKDALIR